MSQNEIETPTQKADRMLKEFVIRCYVLLMQRMLPQETIEHLEPVAQLAEQAMTEVPVLKMHEGLKDAVYNLVPFHKENAEAMHSVMCDFATRVMGALACKGQEIVDGAFTGDDFFNQFG